MLTRIALITLLVVSSGCGFQLRGTDSAIASSALIFVDASRNSSIRDELRKVLSDRSFRVVDNRDLANVLLRVADERLSQRIVSVQSTGIVSEYELAHSVNIQIAQSQNDQQPVYDQGQANNRVEVVRQYTFDQGGVLGKEDEAEILRTEMREELSLQIVLRTIATLASSNQNLEQTQ